MKEGILILGAGPAGMAAAFELYKAGKSFTVIEKNAKVGGLARTLQYAEFRTDIGPHRFFSQNQYLYDLIEDLLGDRWIKVNRLTRFYVNGKFFLYPVEIKNVLLNLGLYKASRCLFDYLFKKIERGFTRRQLRTFEDYVVSEFGRTLAELNILDYTKKIWGLPCSQISLDWAIQRIRGLSLTAVIKKTLTRSKEGPKTLVDQFYYPDLGTALIYEKIKERILRNGNCVLETNSYPVKITHNNNIITVHVNINGKKQIYNPEYVISSVPITKFVELLEPQPPSYVLQSAKNLNFRSHVSLFLTLNKPFVFPDQWIYFPDKEIPFGRVTEPKNFSKKMSAPDKTSLLVEFFCWENDKIWNTNKEELFELSLTWLEKLKFIKRNDVINYFINKERYAYPVYDLNYKQHKKQIESYLRTFKNVQYIGRAGCFKYNNQDHALEMGILAARSIIEGKQYDIETVGSEKEYFEKGYVK